MQYYNIIPCIKLPLSKNPSFTYASKNILPFGTIVKIPFGKNSILGIVTKRTNKPQFPTKEIFSVEQLSQITEKQLKLAQFVSDYYFSPLGIVAKLFFKKLTKEMSSPNCDVLKKTANHPLTKKQKSAVSTIEKNRGNNDFLLFGPASSGKTEVAMRVIQKILKSGKKQALVLIPEIFLAHQEIMRYSERFNDFSIAFLHSNIKSSQYSFIYNHIKSGKIRIVVSTRAGLFLPFRSLGIVVVDEEQDPSYKQWDQSPFYEAGLVSRKLAKIHNAKTLFLSSTPSAKIFGEMGKNQMELIKIPPLQTKKFSIRKPEIVIVDLLKNYRQKQRIWLSPEVKKALAENLEDKKISLVLVPRKGECSFSFCQDCKKILLCPNCQSPLNHFEDNFRCLHCRYKKSVITRCSNCGSFRIVGAGIGTQSVQKELRQIHPEAKILTADSDVFRQHSARERIYTQLKKNTVDILVGTYSIAKGFDIPNISLAAILNADDWPGKIDFNFDEHFLGNLFQLAGRVNRPKSNQDGKCIIQTIYPKNDLLKMLYAWDWHAFIKKELAERRNLAFPPFFQLIRLTLKEETQKKVEKKAQAVYDDLIESADADGKILISEPYFGFNKQKKGGWSIHILLKVKGKLPEILRKKIFKISPIWKIDVDPRSIF